MPRPGNVVVTVDRAAPNRRIIDRVWVYCCTPPRTAAAMAEHSMTTLQQQEDGHQQFSGTSSLFHGALIM